MEKGKITVAVSGGFDPLHVGHIRLIQAARKMGNRLVVILNNDHWLLKKKGFIFMPQEERKELLEALQGVEEVVLTRHPKNPQDMSVNEALLRVRPNIFCNGGDRTQQNIPEVPVCRKLGIRMVFNVGRGGKIQSSSRLLSNFAKKTKAFKRS